MIIYNIYIHTSTRDIETEIDQAHLFSKSTHYMT